MKHIIIIVIALVSFSNLNAQWYQVNSNTTENIKDIFMLDSLNGYCVGGGDQFGFPQGNGIIMETIDGGENWTGLFAMDSLSVNNVFVVTAGQNQKLIAFATKNGISFMLWTTINTQFQNWILEPISYTPIEPKLHNNAIYFVNEINNHLYKLEDTQIDTVSNNSSKIFCVNYDGITYINTSYDSIFSSSNFGLNWITLSSFPNNFSDNQSNYAKLFTNLDTITIKATYPGMVISSFNNGVTWVENLGAPDFHSQIISPNNIYCIDNFNRLQFTQDFGGTWTIQDSLSGSIFYSKIYFYNIDFGFAFGENGQLYKTINGGGTVGIDELETSKKKINIYPNPAKDVLQISVPNGVEIENIELFEIGGKKAKTYNTTDRNLNISGLSSGTYILRISTSEGGLAEKVVIE